MLEMNATLFNQVLSIAQQAGEHLKQFYTQNVEVAKKSDHTPVTEADLFVSRFLIDKLSALTPEIPILSEEHCNIPLATRQSWQQYWLIDPLDGTQQFIDKTDQFSVIITLVIDNQPRLGIIHAPILDKTYYAIEHQGAFLIEKGQVKSLTHLASASSCKDSQQSHRLIIAVGSTNPRGIREKIKADYEIAFLQYGSSSLKAGLVAEGICDCYIRLGATGEWDTAAAEILLKEVGGKIFDRHFQPLTYNQRASFINPDFVMVRNADYNWRDIFLFDENIACAMK